MELRTGIISEVPWGVKKVTKNVNPPKHQPEFKRCVAKKLSDLASFKPDNRSNFLILPMAVNFHENRYWSIFRVHARHTMPVQNNRGLRRSRSGPEPFIPII